MRIIFLELPEYRKALLAEQFAAPRYCLIHQTDPRRTAAHCALRYSKKLGEFVIPGQLRNHPLPDFGVRLAAGKALAPLNPSSISNLAGLEL